MRRIRLLSSVFATGLCLAAAPASAVGQTAAPPAISQRSFTGGSAKVKVTGAFAIDEEIAINTKASYGDGVMTWLQFGASGAAEANSLITYGETGETGVNVAKGKMTAVAGIMPGEKSECSGKVEVTETLVTGDYTCVGVTSYDPATFSMSKVDIKVRFTAKS